MSTTVCRSFLACGLALCVASAAAAQQQQPPDKPVATTGTAEEQRVEPVKRQGFIAKTQVWAEKQHERFIKPMNDAGFKPQIGTLGQGSGLAAGLTYHRQGIAGPLDFEGFAGYSYRGYELYDLRFGQLRHPKGRTTLRPPDEHISSTFDAYHERVPGFAMYGHVRYRHSPLHRYFGGGPDSFQDDRTSFTMRGASYQLVTEYQPTRHFGIAARGGVLDAEVGPGGDTKRPTISALFDDTTAPGLRRQPAFAYMAGAMALDNRDEPGTPHSGGLFGVLVSRFHAINIGPENLSFTRLGIDGRYFVPVASSSVLAFRTLASRDFGAEETRVPFYLQQTLGGGDTLRGFERDRFRDTAVMNVSAEFRQDVHKNVEVAIFGDTGQVAATFGRMGIGTLETSWGGGLRFKHKGSVIFRADLATSREGRRLILSTGPVF
jgi:hypothetical protein